MCIITGLVALFSTFTAVGTALGASTGAAATVGVIATVVADVAITAAVAGGVISTVSAANQAQAAQDQADYQAQIARQNQLMAEREAEQIELQGNQERAKLRLSMLEKRGEARTHYASNGVVLGSGSASDMEADIADAYDLDRRNLDYDIATKQWQAKVDAVNHANSAQLYSAQAAAYGQQKTTGIISGTLDTVSNTISTGASLFSLGSSIKRSGILSSTSPTPAAADVGGESFFGPYSS